MRLTDWENTRRQLEELRTSPEPENGPVVPLAELGGPYEVMQTTGLTNRGSIAYALKHRRFPKPVLTLHGTRLWDLREVRKWTERNR